MRILVLGGTVFLGRHIVDAALARGHEVTLFNRGRANPDLYPELEKLVGDRDGDLAALAGRDWDAVVDTSGYVPRIVRETIDALGTVGHYTFVSSISVYDLSTPVSEGSPLRSLAEPTEEVDGESYGPLKAECEQVVRGAYPDALVVRPGLIVGPWDPTGRFTYWPARLAEGGRVLAPAPGDTFVQVVDARDLAEWIVACAERRLAGTYDAVSPPFPIADLIETCRSVAGATAELVWVDPEFLIEQEVDEWMEIPLWLHDPQFAHMLDVDASRAHAAGLTIRPLEETVRATLDWVRSGEAPTDPPAGLDRAKEQQLLDAWFSKQ